MDIGQCAKSYMDTFCINLIFGPQCGRTRTLRRQYEGDAANSSLAQFSSAVAKTSSTVTLAAAADDDDDDVFVTSGASGAATLVGQGDPPRGREGEVCRSVGRSRAQGTFALFFFPPQIPTSVALTNARAPPRPPPAANRRSDRKNERETQISFEVAVSPLAGKWSGRETNP